MFAVRAVDAAGNVSGNSLVLPVTTPAPPPDTTPPVAPAVMTARLDSPTQVTLRWTAASDDVGVVGYRVTRDGVALRTVNGLTTTDTRVPAGAHTYGVTAIDAAGNASATTTGAAVVPAAAPGGLTGTYFDTDTFTTQRTVRTDPTVNFGWGTGRPASNVAPDTFSVRWTGRVLPAGDGTWTFYASSDDAVRVWVDGRLVVDDWTPHVAPGGARHHRAHRRPDLRHPDRLRRTFRVRDRTALVERTGRDQADRADRTVARPLTVAQTGSQRGTDHERDRPPDVLKAGVVAVLSAPSPAT